jgi:hypothetical protein
MDPDESTKLALEHSRELFIYHAGQRIQSLNFYFVAITVFLTGFGALAISEVDPVDRALFGIVLASAGFYLTLLFQRLDKRNEQLVHCDEFLLEKAEKKLADLEPALIEWKVTESAKKLSNKVRHYTEIVPSIFGLYQILSIIAGMYSVWPWAKTALGL